MILPRLYRLPWRASVDDTSSPARSCRPRFARLLRSWGPSAASASARLALRLLPQRDPDGFDRNSGSRSGELEEDLVSDRDPPEGAWRARRKVRHVHAALDFSLRATPVPWSEVRRPGFRKEIAERPEWVRKRPVAAHAARQAFREAYERPKRGLNRERGRTVAASS